MSFLVVLNSYTSTRLGVSLLDRSGEKGKNRTTVASHLPYGIAILVSAAFDIVTLIFVARAGRRTIDDGYVEATVIEDR